MHKKCVLAVVLAFCAMLPMFASGRTKVACVGDSITYGLGLAHREAESYPAKLQTLLDERFPGGYEVRNFGNSGRGIYLDSMRGTEKRGFRWMVEHKAALDWWPDIVICNLGINDCGEYIKEYSGARKRGNFKSDYLALLDDYRAANPAVRLFIWTKLAPLTQGQNFYRSPEPFLMQRDLEDVAHISGATGIDMLEPLRDDMDSIFERDHIHPNAHGSGIIAEKTASIIAPASFPGTYSGNVDSATGVEIPEGSETWLMAGQSNMQKGWGEFNQTPEEKVRVANEMARLAKCDIWFWDFNDGSFRKLTADNALAKCAFGISFAIRRAKSTGKRINIFYVAAGGAPTEAFLSESTMCDVWRDAPGPSPIYPHLANIATNRHRLDKNQDFPCSWVAREYPRRLNNLDEAHWWPVAALYDHGLNRLKGIHFDGVLWYQGESNATTCVAPDTPTDREYQKETLQAVIAEFRRLAPKAKIVVMGLPKMNRPWQQYREVQREVCNQTGAVFVDTFAAGLGDFNDVHPRDKAAFADLAADAAR